MSSKSWGPSARRMVFSWPLPRIKTRSPFLASLKASLIAFSRSSSLKRSLSKVLPSFLAPLIKPSAILLGSSSRESSSVMMTISECLARISPLIGRVEGSRRPAPPWIEIILPL